MTAVDKINKIVNANNGIITTSQVESEGISRTFMYYN